MRATPSKLRRFVGIVILLSIAVFPFVLGLGMTKGISHDEHQHIAAGALMAREGLLPYRDFPVFHPPYLAFIYSLLFGLSEHLLLAARLFSVLCATLIIGLIGGVASHVLHDRAKNIVWLPCGGVVLIGLTSVLFTSTTGLAWNQEPALLCALVASLAHLAGLRQQHSGWYMLSGALLGLAIGTRITYAPLVAPFFIAIPWLSPKPRWRIIPFACLIAGLVIGGAGFLYFFIRAPEQCYFGNFEFSQVNILYRFSTGEPRTMTLLKKLRFFFKLILRPDFALFAAGALPCVASLLARHDTGRPVRRELRFVLLLFPSLLMGSFAPSPLFDQYFYPLVPFTLLAGVYAVASIPSESRWFRRSLVTGAACVALSVALSYRGYRHLGDFLVTREWATTKLAQRAEELRHHIPTGRVLTLAPAYPLEAGLSIYPAFSTGPFAWRIAPYVESRKAARLGLVTSTTLEAMLGASPPGAILVGFEKTGEEEFVKFAAMHGYQALRLMDGRTLWLAPRER